MAAYGFEQAVCGGEGLADEAAEERPLVCIVDDQQRLGTGHEYPTGVGTRVLNERDRQAETTAGRADCLMISAGEDEMHPPATWIMKFEHWSGSWSKPAGAGEAEETSGIALGPFREHASIPGADGRPYPACFRRSLARRRLRKLPSSKS